MEKLIEDFPDLFSECQYIECLDGWFLLLHDLCQGVEKEKSKFKFTQIKEKFGRLRIYSINSNALIDFLIDNVEEKSSWICEVCGEEGRIIEKNFWLKCRCPEHELS